MNNGQQFQELLKSIVREDILIDELYFYTDDFMEFSRKVLSGGVNSDDPELAAFLRCCLDYYTYSGNGGVLIPDTIYDQCMNVYKSEGNSFNFYADTLGSKKWKFIKHEIPGMVGTLGKIYNYQELKEYLDKYKGVEYFILAPKFDGVSCSIHVENGKIISAATRYNGIEGQDITELIKRTLNAKNFQSEGLNSGYYKCELCVSTKSYNELCEIKKYANRRSATSGIINTPSNIEFAKFVTIIPLLFYNRKEIRYVAPYQKEYFIYSPMDLMNGIEYLLEHIRDKDFPFRVDGVVIYPSRERLHKINESDLMENSIAYKVNTAESKTKIEYGYMSIGRLGKAVPMLKVAPVEVNETIVEDASLGSYDKFLSMNLRENEEIIVYSAGDVIPQVKLPLMRTNFDNDELLSISRICPYCETKLTRINSEYYCQNNDCPRIITGKIVNFLDKLGVVGFSDRSVEIIYEGLGIKTISEFINLTKNDIKKIPGFDIASAESLEIELNKIKTKPVLVSKFIGALGIDKIAEKKCRKIFECITLSELLDKKNPKKFYWNLRAADGIGPKTAETFLEFVEENREMINQLSSQMKIVDDIKYKANVVFTGFRDDTLAKEFNNLGYEVSDTVTGNTIAVIAASIESNSIKLRTAKLKGLPIVLYSDVNDILYKLKCKSVDKEDYD